MLNSKTRGVWNHQVEDHALLTLRSEDSPVRLAVECCFVEEWASEAAQREFEEAELGADAKR